MNAFLDAYGIYVLPVYGLAALLMGFTAFRTWRELRRKEDPDKK